MSEESLPVVETVTTPPTAPASQPAGEASVPTLKTPSVPLEAGVRDPKTGQFLPKGSVPPGQKPPTEKPVEAPPPAKFKRTLKVNGAEEEVEATEDELWAEFRQAKASYKRFEEAAQMRRQAEEEIKAAKALKESVAKGPLQFLIDQGYTPQDAIAIMEADAQRQLGQMQMTPEQRELHQYRQREEAEKEAKRQAEAQQQQEVQMAEFKRMLDADAEVLQKAMELGGYPKTDWALELFARDYYAKQELGIDLSPQELAQAVSNTHSALVDKAISSYTDDEALLKAYPGIAKRFVSAVKAQYEKSRRNGNAVSPVAASPQPPPRRAALTDTQSDVLMGLRPPPPGFKVPPGWEAEWARLRK